MPEQNRNAHLDRPLPPPPPTNTHSKSLLASMIRWLQIKKYQYEVTFSLYMLTATEKFVFSEFEHPGQVALLLHLPSTYLVWTALGS